MASVLQLDLLTLSLFVAVCEETSINRAAEREHIAPSALSRRLTDLEAYFKVPLFRRHARGLDPTPAGLALLRHARILMRDMEQMDSEMTDHSTGLKGKITIRANVWSIVQYLPEELNAFLLKHPRLTVEVEEALSSATIKAVAEQAADIGIIGSNVAAPGLEVIPFRRDRLVVVVPTGHPLEGRPSVRIPDLLPYDIIGARHDSALNHLLVRGMQEANTMLNIRIRVSGPETVCRMAEAKFGIGFVPSACAIRHRDSMGLAIVPLDEPWGLRELYLCTVPGVLPQHVQLLVDHLRQRD